MYNFYNNLHKLELKYVSNTVFNKKMFSKIANISVPYFELPNTKIMITLKKYNFQTTENSSHTTFEIDDALTFIEDNENIKNINSYSIKLYNHKGSLSWDQSEWEINISWTMNVGIQINISSFDRDWNISQLQTLKLKIKN